MLIAVNIISCGEGVHMVVHPKKLLQHSHHKHYNHYKLYKHHMKVNEPIVHTMKVQVEVIQNAQTENQPEEAAEPVNPVQNAPVESQEPSTNPAPVDQQPQEATQPESQEPAQTEDKSQAQNAGQGPTEQITAAPAQEAAGNQPSQEDDLFKTFLYFESTSGNVKYFYPKEALKRYQMQGNELEFFAALGGGPGIVKMVKLILLELLNHQQLRAQFENQLHLVTKDLIDFFIVLINGDGRNYDQIRYAYDHINFLQCIDFAEFILLTAKAAKILNIREQYVSVILERLDYCKINIVKAK